jgi:hypothetical protein
VVEDSTNSSVEQGLEVGHGMCASFLRDSSRLSEVCVSGAVRKANLRNEPIFACDVRRLSARAVQTERLWVEPEAMGSLLLILGEKSNPSGITQRETCEAVGPGGNISEVRALVECGWLRLAARNTSQGRTAMCVAAPTGRTRKQ